MLFGFIEKIDRKKSVENSSPDNFNLKRNKIMSLFVGFEL